MFINWKVLKQTSKANLKSSLAVVNQLYSITELPKVRINVYKIDLHGNILLPVSFNEIV